MSTASKHRLYLVDYRLTTGAGTNLEFGGGTCRIEATSLDSICRQLNAILDGRPHKLMQCVPVT